MLWKFFGYMVNIVGLSTIGLLSGCGSTSIFQHHILIEHDAKKPAANVYFIRPFTYRERGVADNEVIIDLDQKKLLELAKGEYTLLRIKPDNATITTHSISMYTNKLTPVKMTKTISVNFEAGKTYFIHIKQYNEEFRGVYYQPELIDLNAAKQLTEDLHATGLARSKPIDEIKS